MATKRPSSEPQFKDKIDAGIEKAFSPQEQLEGLEKELQEKIEKTNKLKKKISEQIKKAFTPGKTEDLAITREEKNKIFNTLNNSPEGESLLKYFGINSMKDLMRRIGLSRIEEQRNYEHYNYSAEKAPGICFRDYDKIVDEPWGKTVLEKALKNGPEFAFAFADRLTQNPEVAKDLLIRAAGKAPQVAFRHAEKLNNIQGANDVLIEALNTADKTDVAFTSFSRYKDIDDSTKVLEHAVDKNYTDAFLHLSQYKGETEASQVLLKAIRKAEDISNFFETTDTDFKEIPDIIQVLGVAVLKDAKAVISHLDKYDDIKGATSILQFAAYTEPEYVLTMLDKWQNLEGAQSVLLTAATTISGENAPYMLVALVNDNFDLQIIKDNTFPILMTAINQKPDIIFGDKVTITKEYHSMLAKTAAFAKPELAFEHKDKIIKLENAEEIIAIAAKKNPLLLYENLNDLKSSLDENAIQNISRVAFNNLKPGDYTSVDKVKIISPHLTGEQKEEILSKIKQCQKFAEEFLEQNINTEQSGRYASKNLPEMIKDLFADKSLQNILQVNPKWIKLPDVSNIVSWIPTPAEARAMVARNLFTAGLPVTKENVTAELNKIISERNKLTDNYIFKDRNVLHVAQPEKIRGQNNFGREGTLNAIKGQSKSMQNMRMKSDADLQKIKNFKEKMIKKIADTSPPLTYVFSGHGSKKNGLALVKSNDVSSIFTPADMARALRLRHEKYGQNPTEQANPPIIIISSCYTANYTRSLYQKLQDTPRPIAMGGAEFGQEAYGLDSHEEFDSVFDKQVLGLGTDKPATFGTVMQNEKANLSNTYLYTPAGQVI